MSAAGVESGLLVGARKGGMERQRVCPPHAIILEEGLAPLFLRLWKISSQCITITFNRRFDRFIGIRFEQEKV